MKIMLPSSLQLLALFLYLLLSVRTASAHAPEDRPALKFIENKNQWPAHIRYRTDLPGGNLFLENNCLTYNFYDAATWNQLAHARHTQPTKTVAAHAYKVHFLDANPAPTLETTQPFPEYHNYFTGDSSTWASRVGLFGEVLYRDLYEGIDLKLYSQNGNLKYDFIVLPGHDLNQIKLRYEGLNTIFLQGEELHLLTSLNHLVEQRPFSYQLVNGRRKEIRCRFVLKNTLLSFELLEPYNHDLPLVIDPALIFATHSGSTAPVFGNTATYDLYGHTYAAGPCYAPGYPTRPGAYQLTFAGGSGQFPHDVAISKYAPDGKQLLFATYLGGRINEAPHSLVVNHKNELLVMGTTSSDDFPVTRNAYDRSYNGGGDIFVSKFDSSGAKLLSSTYIGGSLGDGLTPSSLQYFFGDQYRGEIIVDDQDNCYIASSTWSADFPTTAGAYQTNALDGLNAVVLQLSPELDKLNWSTLLGGSDADAAFALHLDSLGQVYVAGATQSNNFPVSAKAFSKQHNGGNRDGFVSLLSPDGSLLPASTYLGTNRDNSAYFIQADKQNQVYVLGTSEGSFPMTRGKYGNSGGGIFLAKLGNLLTGLEWSTTLGNRVTPGGTSPADAYTNGFSPTAFLVDNCGYIYFSAWGNTVGVEVTPNALQRTTDGQDLYLAVLQPEATGLHYATYIGGTSVTRWSEEHVDGGTSRFDKRGIIHQAICTNAHNFPTTPGAYSPVNRVRNNAYDKVALKLDFDLKPLEASASASPSATGEVPFTVKFSNNTPTYGNTSFSWTFGDGNSSTSYSPSHTYTATGTYTVRLVATDSSTCGSSDTLFLQIIVIENDSTYHGEYTICNGDSVQLSISPEGNTNWKPDASLSDLAIASPWASPASTTTYEATITDEAGLLWKAFVTVHVIQPEEISFQIEKQCYPDRNVVTLRPDQAAAQINWHFGDGDSASVTVPSHSYTRPGQYTIRMSGIDQNGCSFFSEKTVDIDFLFIPNIITPNNDNLNDTFVASCLEPGVATLHVYNRWGRRVYDSGENAYLNQWAGEGLSDGIYYYHLHLSDSGTTHKGWVEIVR